ncbi:MAG: hypothetical protein H7Y17_08710 [Chlorobia bacterium]|nr:hypothetical protein [Fimbriimonadaceae bacterium]
MSEILVIARLRVMATDALLLSHRNMVQDLEPNRTGLTGITTWRSIESDGGIMQIMRYADKEAADAGLRALVESKAGPLVASVTIDPPDVAVVTPKKQSGKRLEDVPVGAFASLAIRFSDPGQQEDLEMDTDEVLAELAFIPGYLGSLWGDNIALPEEIVSFVLWATQDALLSSIPNTHKVKIQKWRKAF